MFKIAAVPLHWYIADVYQGAASSVAGLLGFVPKLAGIVAILKVVSLTGWQTAIGGLFWMLWIVAALSMTVGNVLALRQTSIKRMLAFSGVAHAGYMLVGVMAGPGGEGVIGDGTAAVLYYVVVYGIANLGAFAILGLLEVRGKPAETLQDVAGLLRRSPGLALLMALAMLALMGLPPTTGFWGKVSLFGSGLALSNEAPDATRAWIIALVIIAGLNTAIGAAYYLRVTAAVLLYENDRPPEVAPRESQYMGAMMCGFLTLVFTVFPSILLNAGLSATGRLRNEAAAYVQRNTSDTLAKANTPADPRPMLPDPSRPADATP
jgi:NADH-quinone oxidoreductase subunit N